jgi:hypothetical protein
MRILRSALVVGALAASVTAGVSPASATPGGSVTCTGTVTLPTFGQGPDHVTNAHLSCTGVIGTTTFNNATATVNFDYNEPSATCPATGTASGTVTLGSYTVSFTWTRVGATAAITTTGAIDGGGVGVFVVAGNPCGGNNVSATVVAHVAGS